MAQINRELQKDKDYRWELSSEKYIKTKIQDMKSNNNFIVNLSSDSALFLFLVPRNLEYNSPCDYPGLPNPPEKIVLNRLMPFCCFYDIDASENEISTYGYYDKPCDILSIVKLERDGNISAVDKTLILNLSINLPYILNEIYKFILDKLKLLSELKYNSPYYIYLHFDSIKDKYYRYNDDHYVEQVKKSKNENIFIKFKVDSLDKDIKQDFVSFVSNRVLNNFGIGFDVYSNFIKDKLIFI